MTVALAWAVAISAPTARAHERDPLPATWVERPLAVPRGWTSATIVGERVRAGRALAVVMLRYGVAPRIELRAGGGAASRRGQVGLADPEIGARWTLLRREPPNTSVATDLSWRAPFGDRPGGVPVAAGVGVLRASALAARQLGPMRATARVGAVVRSGSAPDGGFGAADVLVQLGPLAALGGAELEVAHRAWLDAFAGAGVQLTRGVGATAVAGGPVTPGVGPVPVEPRGPTLRAALELSW